MRRVQADDAEAFAALYNRFSGRARHLARAIARDAHADDIVQEAFLSVWRGRAAFRPELGTVPGWVMGTVRNRAVDSLRSQNRHDTRRADADGLAEKVHAPGDLASEIAERDQAARLRECLSGLPPGQRDVITLAYFGELSAREVAQELSLPLGTVKGRMRLGLNKLRDPMDEERSDAQDVPASTAGSPLATAARAGSSMEHRPGPARSRGGHEVAREQQPFAHAFRRRPAQALAP